MTVLPPLRDVIQRHGLTAQKRLGQNFLLDVNLTQRIARAAGPLDGVSVIEIGPGPGGLTRGLLAEGAIKIIAIERDGRAIPALAELQRAYPGRLDVIEGDALQTDTGALVSGPVKIVANLPYNIATPLLIGWLSGKDWPPFYHSLTLMFQKEVAQRITAAPGTKAYGRLSVICQWRCRVERLFDVDPRAFTPPPKVTSSIVQLVPQAPKIDCPVAALEKVTAAAFGQRRKMLRQSLKGLTPEPTSLLDAAGLDAELRAENLSVDDFCRLAQAIS